MKYLWVFEVGHTCLSVGQYNEQGEGGYFTSLVTDDALSAMPVDLKQALREPGAVCLLLGSAERRLPVLANALRKYGAEVVELNELIRQGCRSQAAAGTGIDRLLNVYAAHALVGGPVLCVDIGTAITFDVGDRSGTFIGGLIMPGPGAALEGLRGRAPHLPPVDRTLDAPLIGRNTVEALTAGSRYGFAAAVSGTISLLSNKLPLDLTVFLTGGGAASLRSLIKGVERYEPELILRGALRFYLHQRMLSVTGA